MTLPNIVPPVVSPYLYVGDSYQRLAAASGTDTFTLAFVTGFRGGKAVWDGGVAPDPAWCASHKVCVSIGGAGSTTGELAGSIRDVSALASAYASIATTYHATSLDFDVEGASANNLASIARRNEALAILQRTHSTKITYTLAVMPSGLDSTGLAILKDAKAHGVKVSAVRVMAMDYGCNTKDMGAAAIKSGTSTRRQLDALGMHDTAVGITPMIGTNDTEHEVFSLKDAKVVAGWTGGPLGFWSLNRDNGTAVNAKANDGHSGVVQKPFEFLNILRGKA